MAISTGSFPKATQGGLTKKKKKVPVNSLGMMFAKMKKKSGS